MEQEQLSGAKIIIRCLEELQIKHVFGFTGAAILPVFDALAKSPIQLIVNANEQSCTFSAAGYSRANKTVGVTIVTSGPAITNTLTAVADSYADSIPLIVIAGQVPEHKIGTDAFQHINVASIFKDASKKVIEIKKTSDIESALKDAYFLATSGKPGPVIIDVPLDKQIETSTYQQIPIRHFKEIYEHTTHLTSNQCEEFFSYLKEAKRPLLYIGGGVNNEIASAIIREFNALYGIPCVNTLMAKGVVDGKETYALGMLGMFGTPQANFAIQETDFFFAIGVRWDDRVAEKVGEFALQAKIAYIDIHQEKVQQIRTERKPVFSCVGDAKEILQDLLDYAKENTITLNITPWQERIQDIKKKWKLQYNKNTKIIQQAEVLEELNTHITKKTIITTGVGNHQMFSAQYLQVSSPKSFLTSGSFGTMGFCLPASIGAQIRYPDKTVIAIDGDGSIKMNLGELHTIGELQLPVKILLFNNHAEGMVYVLQSSAYNNVHIGTKRNNDVNYAKLAEIFGFTYTKRITKKEEISSALKNFITTKGPAFLEVICDKDEAVYPKIAPGKQYKDMELGPYIQKNT